jgi:hypothetical protein
MHRTDRKAGYEKYRPSLAAWRRAAAGRGFGEDWGVELNVVGTRYKNRDGDLALRQ